MIPISSTTILSKGKEIKIHAISTGLVKVKTKFRSATKRGILAKLDFVFDKEFTEWVPIWVWVIEHPEGIFVVDTGINANINDPGYFKSTGIINNWVNTSLFKFQISKEEEIDSQLKTLNIATKDVKKVIMTHMHIDHFDGMCFFENSEVIVNRAEWDGNKESLPALYPKWLDPKLVDLNQSIDVFEKSLSLTKANDLHLVFTPGHTVGHCSVLLKGDKLDVLFAGDITYFENQLLTGEFSASIQDNDGNVDTYEKVLAHSKSFPLIFLPSHDRHAGERLANQTVLGS
jgi:N-acyl homoserine lactone hydrolase